MKYDKIYTIIIITFLFLFVLLILFAVITKTEKTYSEENDCEYLRECIILDMNCLDRHINNSFFGFHWGFDDKAFLNEQSEYYFEKCVKESEEE